jgi:hypothetical protein
VFLQSGDAGSNNRTCLRKLRTNALVRGTVETGEGATIAIFNADDESITESFREATAGRGGVFELGNLRPGSYYVVALDRNDPRIATPDFRRAVASRAEKLQLAKGATVILNLKITPLPE